MTDHRDSWAPWAPPIDLFRFDPPPGFIDPATCDHTTTEPVYAYYRATVHAARAANDGRPVARICVDCGNGLQAGWGCDDCVWEQVEPPRMLCEPVAPPVEHVLVRPCKEHA